MHQGVLRARGPEAVTIDLKHMLKVYNYVNDDKKPKFNLKFLAVFVGLVVAVGALVAFALLRPTAPAPEAGAASKTDYVGLSPGESAMAAGSGALLQSRLDAWYAAHPDAQVESVTPQYDGGRLVGYEIRYRD